MASESPNEPKKIPLRIRLPFSTEEEFIQRYGEHVTRGGIFVATKHGKAQGTFLSFELLLADGSRLMRGEGVVEKLVDPQPGGKPGMLVRFTRIDPRTKGLIDLILDRRAGLENAQPPTTSHSPPLPPPSAPAPSRRPGVPASLKQGAVPLGEDVVLGIDLGTTACRAAVMIEGQPTLVPIGSERGSFALPSIVAFDVSKNRVLIGSAARKHRIEHPEEAVIGFKRLMGRRAQSKKVREMIRNLPYTFGPDPQGDLGIQLGGRVFSISEFASPLLRELKNAAQNFLGRELKRAVLCVPAWYSDHQRAAVLTSGRLAGLDVVSILNEPSAVAMAFGYGRGLARKRVLVCDLGGGTFDASVVEIVGDDLEAVSTAGDNFLGGMDFDARLADGLIGTMERQAKAHLLQSRFAIERVRDAAEVTKITLSEKDMTPVHVPFATAGPDGNPVDLRAEVERSFLEAATRDLVERAGQITQTVLEAANLNAQSLDQVLLVGGQSRAPAVRRHLEQLLGRTGRTDIDAGGAVALGAAVLGHSFVQKERGKRGPSLSEVLSLPIGVAVKGGGFRRVLERNTRLPAEKAFALPVEALQTIQFAVMQGTSTRAEENEYLGALSIQAERSGDLNVRFSVSADGRLSLSATTPTGKRAEVHFSTAEASETSVQQLLAESPLPFDEGEAAGVASDPSNSSLLGGIKRLFGSR